MLNKLIYKEKKAAALTENVINVTGQISAAHMPKRRSTEILRGFVDGPVVFVKKWDYSESDDEITFSDDEDDDEYALTCYRTTPVGFNWVSDSSMVVHGQEASPYNLSYEDSALAAYLLPWMEDGICWVALDHGAPFFFTDTLSGCSFGVAGNPIAPIVFHSNVGAEKLRDKNTDEQFKFAVDTLARQGMDRKKLVESLRVFTKKDCYISAAEREKKATSGFVLAGTQANIVGFSTSFAWEFWCQRYALYAPTGESGKRTIVEVETFKLWP